MKSRTASIKHFASCAHWYGRFYLLPAAMTVGVVYVLAHFIVKYW